MLDLDGNALQVIAGVGDFLDAQTAVGSVLKGDRGHLAVNHGDGLAGVPGQGVVFRRYDLGNGIGAGNSQRHHDGAAGVGGILANDVAAGTLHLKDCTGQRRLGAFLDLDDLQAGFRVIRDFAGAVLADGQYFHSLCGVRITQIFLNITIFICLSAGGVKDTVLIGLCL